MIQALIDSFRIPDLRYRIIFTLSMLVLFRFLAHVPVVNVDPEGLRSAFNPDNPGGQLLGFLNLFSGGGLRNMSIVALGAVSYTHLTLPTNREV